MQNKTLIIVESPTKARTIGEFLGDKYRLESSYGHVRDLPKGSLGVDVEKNFEPKYVIPTKSRKNVTNLKKTAEKADKVIIATDEDREGEAIAWHILKSLGLGGAEAHDKRLKVEGDKEVERIVFHEITEEAIREALENPREINMDMVNAQQARRVLDRLVGYKLSPFLWKKIASHLSAGRVQSVALRLITDREDEIREFNPEKYWTVGVSFKKDNISFESSLVKIKGKDFPKPGMKDQEEVDKISDDLKNSEFSVASVEKKEANRSPLPPFTTSTLQQETSKRLNFSAKQTMMFAQRLYEKGLITYMRTDSVNLSQSSLTMARSWIEKNFGKEYALSSPRVFKTKSRLAQEAHEAIRPTKLDVDTGKMEPKEGKLFELIKGRFLASQMPPAVFSRTKVDIKTGAGDYLLRSNGQVLKFDGYLRAWSQKHEEVEVPELEKDEALNLEKVLPEEHETTPPPRFNEASLIKTLEENGIGRPSTYAPIISVLTARNYIEKDSNRRFHPTEIGEMVSKVLKEHFPDIVDVNFTAEMEEKLDKIAEGSEDWHEVIGKFFGPFNENLEKKYEEVSKEDVVGKEEETDEVCEKCGKPMAIKRSRFGRFLACTGFPDCRNTKSLDSEKEALGKCPKCKKGEIVKKRTKKGRFFFGCDKYPDCDFAKWTKKELDKEMGKKEEE